MIDTLSIAERSERMSRVRSKDTRSEMIVRRLVYGMGFRYRLHDAHLPGKPDMVFRSRRKVIFVHGCFWHRHKNCSLARMPKSRVNFWQEKLNGNRARDKRSQRQLEKMGWSVLVVWECELKGLDALQQKIEQFLGKVL